MKKFSALMLAMLLAVSFAACGGKNDDENVENDATAGEETAEQVEEEVVEEEPIVIPGTYVGVSLYNDAAFTLNENGSFDKPDTEEKGTYTADESGNFDLKYADSSSNYTYSRHGNYYYRSTSICNFYEDDDYGMAPTFDDSGKSNQVFDAFYGFISNDLHPYMIFTMKNDGTFIIEDTVRSNTEGIVDHGYKYEGTYSLDGEVLTLNWNGQKGIFLFIDGKIFFDVYEKQTDDNKVKMEAYQKALAEHREKKWLPTEDEAKAQKVISDIQGEWEYTGNGVNYYLVINGNNLSLTTSAGSSSVSLDGVLTVCEDFILITYDHGGQATMDYELEDDGTYSFYPIRGIYKN